jgi:hypothetical protein
MTFAVPADITTTSPSDARPAGAGMVVSRVIRGAGVGSR